MTLAAGGRMSGDYTSINVPSDVAERLGKHGAPGETWGGILTRMLDTVEAPAILVDKRAPEEPGLWVKIPADKIDYISVSRNHAPELGITGQYCPDIDTLPIDYETARQGIDILAKRKEAEG